MGMPRIDSINELLNRDQDSRQVLLFNLPQVPYLLGKELDPASAASDKHSLALSSRSDPNDSAVATVLRFDDEFLLFQGVYDPGHRWRPHLFGFSQLAQCDWAVENDHGKG
jgi:hypothetical protein